jgi:hypothetical protein
MSRNRDELILFSNSPFLHPHLCPLPFRKCIAIPGVIASDRRERGNLFFSKAF